MAVDALAVLVRPARPEDVLEASSEIRRADRLECWAAFHREIEVATLSALQRSTLAWTGFVGGELVALFGAAPISLASGQGAPWLVATNALERHARSFLRHCPTYLAAMQEAFPVLANYVDSRNYKAIRWLEWLGAELQPALPYGFDRIPFHPFSWRRRV